MTEKSSVRRLNNWIDSWLIYSNVLSSPPIFRKWAGIGILSGVLERKVWVHTKGSRLYPNLYIILVGPPGVGKSAILSQSERILRSVPELYVAPSSLTTASLIDTLELAKRKLFPPKDPILTQFNSLQVIASELGVFLPAYDPAFMNTLTKLYDGELYEERRRTGKVNHIRIDSPQLNIVGGTTPSYLNSFLPDGAWDQGFTSRTIFVYCGVPVKTAIFSDEGDFQFLEKTYIDLAHDLRLISESFGKMEWDKEASNAISAWYEAGLPPIPEHGKLAHYNSRRLAHAIKLCMVAAIARSSELHIRLVDYQIALEWLLEIEALLPDIFNSMGISGDARAIEDLWHYIFKMYSKGGKKPVSEHRVWEFLRDRVPSHSIQKIIEVMVRSRMLKQDLTGGVLAYIPGEKDT